MKQRWMKKQKTIQIILLIMLLASLVSVEGVLISPGVTWEIGNETYTVNQTMNFSQIIIASTYIVFNETGFNVTSSNNILITLDYINEDIKNAASDTKVVGFYADTIGGDVWMNISGFSINTAYDVYKDSVLHDSYTTNSTGVLPIFSDSWSEYLFDVYLAGNSAPTQSTPSPGNETTGVGVSTSSVSVTVTDADGDTFNWTITTYPDIGSDSANDESDGVKSCSISALTYDYTYNWYVNVTDGNYWTNNSYWFTTESNTAPSISSPSPGNGSTGIGIGTSSISVTIADSETTFNWTITTSPNIGSDSANDESTGSKTCSISGLNYDMLYYWTVTATDGTTWTNRTYHFTVQSDPGGGPPPNSAPVVSNPYPTDGSTLQVITPICNVLVTDANIDSMDVNFYNSTDGGNWYWQQKNSSVMTGTTLYWTYDEAAAYNTLHYWRVTANDGTINASYDFSFTTYPNNPVVTNPIPADGATGIDVESRVTITVSDYQGDNMNIYWNSNVSSSWVCFGNNITATNGTYRQSFTNASRYLTRYWWSVNVTDGTSWTNATYSYTTEATAVTYTFTVIYPYNGTTTIDGLFDVPPQIDIINNKGRTFYWWINTSNGDTWTDNGNVSYSIDSIMYVMNDLNNNTIYWWNVTVYDYVDNKTTRMYWFTTGDESFFTRIRTDFWNWSMQGYEEAVGFFLWPILFLGVIGYVYFKQQSFVAAAVAIIILCAAFAGTGWISGIPLLIQLMQIIVALALTGLILYFIVRRRR